MLTDHVTLLVLLATLISSFLALLFREERRERLEVFVRTWLCLVGGSLALAWLLLPFPGAR